MYIPMYVNCGILVSADVATALMYDIILNVYNSTTFNHCVYACMLVDWKCSIKENHVIP